MRKAIAVDFDGTLFRDAYPLVGEPNWPVINKAKEEQAKGAGIILWTCRIGEPLDLAVEACKKVGLIPDAVNESLPEWQEAWDGDTRKVGATEYWDDRAINVKDVIQKCPWIPVNERLPEAEKSVLLLCKNKAMFTGYQCPDYSGEARWRVHTALKSTKLLNKGRVTHWMPLPGVPE